MMQAIAHLAQLAGVFLVSGIWQGFILATAVWLCLRLVPKTSPAMRFAIWSVVLLLVAFLPVLEALLRGQAGERSGSLPAVFTIDVRWSLAIIGVWGAFSAYRAADLGLHASRLWLLRRRSTPVSRASHLALLAGSHRPVTLCTSTDIDKPGVIGFFAPRILVPAWLLDQLSEAELEQIVLHEMEHLHRGDDWLNLLQKLSLVIFPLNPVLIWVERRLCFERELACDDGVLRRTRAPHAYATCLTNLAERSLDRRVISLALGALGAFGVATRQSELARRVHRILRREETLSPRNARFVTVGAAFGLFTCAIALAHCPQVVSFAAASPQAPMAQLGPVSVHSNFAGQAENVVYREGREPHATLLGTSFPMHSETAASRFRKAKGVSHKRPHSQTPALQRTVQPEQRQRAATNSGWIMLSSWSAADQSRSDQKLKTDVAHPLGELVETMFVPHYAAVPTDGGWLIIQL